MQIWKCSVIALLALLSCTWAEYVGESDEPQDQELKDLPGEDAPQGHDMDLPGQDALKDDGKDSPESEEEEDEKESAPEEDEFTAEQFEKLHAMMDADKNSKVSLDEILKFSNEQMTLAADKKGKDLIQELDKDKDGKVSAEEYLKDLTEAAKTMDADKIAIQRAEEEGKFSEVDENSDGMLTEQELIASVHPKNTVKSTMDKHDKDGDEQLTMKEFLEEDDEDGEEKEARTFDEDEVSMFKTLDKDGNGKLNMKELLVWESGHFQVEEAMVDLMKVADADNDKHVTMDEIIAAQEKDESNANFHFMDWIKHHEL